MYLQVCDLFIPSIVLGYPIYTEQAFKQPAMIMYLHVIYSCLALYFAIWFTTNHSTMTVVAFVTVIKLSDSSNVIDQENYKNL